MCNVEISVNHRFCAAKVAIFLPAEQHNASDNCFCISTFTMSSTLYMEMPGVAVLQINASENQRYAIIISPITTFFFKQIQF